MRCLLATLLIVVTSGCAYNRQYFRPTERVRGQTLQGYQEAFYDLVGPNGAFGEAKVWSVGAYRRGDDSVVEVTLELHNTSARPIEVSAKDLLLDPVRSAKGLLRELPPAETGVFRVEPEARAMLRVHFVLPKGVLPGHVRSFGFAWRVKNVDQSYAQATPFREEVGYYGPPPSGSLYYNSVYPCSPYDLNCVGFYGDWPYYNGVGVGYYGSPVIIDRTPEPRRRVDVRN
jgi:hypothetical protein